MHVTRLALHDFRSYVSADLELAAGPTAFIGGNGQGKTNLVEAIDYVAGLESHRVAVDAPLIRAGADLAVVRVDVQRDDRNARLEVEIASGRANRGRINGAAVPRLRDMIGVLRTVMFSPEDLALVKGDPGDRRRFIDGLLTLRSPRLDAVRADYDRVLKQRNTLLKSARGRGGQVDLSTLDIWDDKLASLGGELVAHRLLTLSELTPHLAESYGQVAADAAADRQLVSATYKPSADLASETEAAALRERLVAGIESRRRDELERGVTLVGPHRDDIELAIGDLPARGYASHGESWSLALALRLASFEVLREEGDDPVLILDDVFAELDSRRRTRLAKLAAEVEQVLVTAAVPEDVPDVLTGHRFDVVGGEVTGSA
ncbi:MAG TPA: DNA replication/repair protein RecF [Aeromicrobium sp.]|nr:DNA replication/repair protein RecF [Aeromicrobium sp.]